MFENIPVIEALSGGILIGIAATLLLYTTGRIAGISGILNGILDWKPDRNWRVFFILGLLLGCALHYHIFTPGRITETALAPWMMVISGFLVGFGTRMGGGCTSGHGVCGLGRLSKRSLVATCTFMATGILTVLIIRLISGGPS